MTICSAVIKLLHANKQTYGEGNMGIFATFRCKCPKNTLGAMECYKMVGWKKAEKNGRAGRDINVSLGHSPFWDANSGLTSLDIAPTYRIYYFIHNNPSQDPIHSPMNPITNLISLWSVPIFFFQMISSPWVFPLNFICVLDQEYLGNIICNIWVNWSSSCWDIEYTECDTNLEERIMSI
jgi:hypothetical protein